MISRMYRFQVRKGYGIVLKFTSIFYRPVYLLPKVRKATIHTNNLHMNEYVGSGFRYIVIVFFFFFK